MTVLGTTASGAQTAPAAAPAAAAKPAAHPVKARPHRVAKRERSEDRTLTALSDRLNKNTVAIIAGGLGSTDLAITHELAAVLDDGDELRILPVVGAGGGRNVRDLRFMKGVDLAITQTNVLARLRASREYGPLDDKIVYVAKLFNEEMHLLVRADSSITAIDQLGGRPVSLGEPGGGTQLVARDVLARLGVSVREVPLDEVDAIARLKAGNIDAVVLVGGKPIPALANLSGLRVLPVPFVKPLRDDFLPATLTSADYPGVIEPGRQVETVAVGTVLVAVSRRKGDQYDKIEKFVEAFFARLADLQAPAHHPKWREVNLAASLPGWTRFAAAQDWLAEHREPDTSARASFDQFLSARGGPPASAAERERLFREFVKWSEARAHR
jgi:TRAP transporter TAXI family solute receptor